MFYHGLFPLGECFALCAGQGIRRHKPIRCTRLGRGAIDDTFKETQQLPRRSDYSGF